MSPIPLGIFSQAASLLDSDYELINTVNIGTTPIELVSFSGLSAYDGTYKHFQIRAVLRNTSASSNEADAFIYFNGDFLDRYSRANIIADDQQNASGSFGYDVAGIALKGVVVGGAASSNTFGVVMVNILDAFDSKRNRVQAFGGCNAGSGSHSAGSYIGMRTSSADIDEIVLEVSPGLARYSRISLYGIKG